MSLPTNQHTTNTSKEHTMTIILDRCAYTDPQPGDVFTSDGDRSRSWASFKVLGPVKPKEDVRTLWGRPMLWIEPIPHDADEPMPEKVWIYAATVHRYRFVHNQPQEATPTMHTTTLTKTVTETLPIGPGDVFGNEFNTAFWAVRSVDPKAIPAFRQVRAFSSILDRESTYHIDGFLKDGMRRLSGDGVTTVEKTEDVVEVKHRFQVGDKITCGGVRLTIEGLFLNEGGKPCYKFDGCPKGLADTVDYYDSKYELADPDAELLATAQFKVGDVVDPFGKLREKDPKWYSSGLFTRKGTISEVFVYKFYDGSREVRYHLAEVPKGAGWHLRDAELLPQTTEHVRVYTITVEATEHKHPERMRFGDKSIEREMKKVFSGEEPSPSFLSALRHRPAGVTWNVTSVTSEVIEK